jgi:hypothetical protein
VLGGHLAKLGAADFCQPDHLDAAIGLVTAQPQRDRVDRLLEWLKCCSDCRK